MCFMIIETFRGQDSKPIYRRLRESGRHMPEGLAYIDSWISADLGRCFQLMEADDLSRSQQWISAWSDLMEFEVIPVVASADTRAALADKLDD